jgi:uncharacterized protein with PQ loop repeat
MRTPSPRHRGRPHRGRPARRRRRSACSWRSPALFGAVLHLVGTTAALIGVTTALPQLWRLIRSPDVAGLSLLSNVLGALSAATWLSYGLWLMDGPQLLANIPGTLGGTAIVVLVVVRTRHAPWWLFGVPVAWGLAAAAAGLVGGAAGVGLAATVIGTASRVPQVRAALTSDELSGISVSSQWLALVSAVLWFTYGAGSALVPVMVSSASAALLIVGVLVPTMRAGRRAGAPAPESVPGVPALQAPVAFLPRQRAAQHDVPTGDAVRLQPDAV